MKISGYIAILLLVGAVLLAACGGTPTTPTVESGANTAATAISGDGAMPSDVPMDVPTEEVLPEESDSAASPEPTEEIPADESAAPSAQPTVGGASGSGGSARGQTVTPPTLDITGKVPAGWQVVTTSDKGCQVAVPKTWFPIEGAGAMAPDTLATLNFSSGIGEAGTFQKFAQSIITFYRHDVVVVNTDKMMYVASTGQGNSDVNYIVAIPSKSGACTAMLTIPQNGIASHNKDAKAILESLSEPKP